MESLYALGSLKLSFCSEPEVFSTMDGLKFAICLNERSANALGSSKSGNYVILLVFPGLKDDALTDGSCILLLPMNGLKSIDCIAH